MKKCRARYGLDQQSQWCKPCRYVCNVSRDLWLVASWEKRIHIYSLVDKLSTLFRSRVYTYVFDLEKCWERLIEVSCQSCSSTRRNFFTCGEWWWTSTNELRRSSSFLRSCARTRILESANRTKISLSNILKKSSSISNENRHTFGSYSSTQPEATGQRCKIRQCTGGKSGRRVRSKKL